MLIRDLRWNRRKTVSEFKMSRKKLDDEVEMLMKWNFFTIFRRGSKLMAYPPQLAMLIENEARAPGRYSQTPCLGTSTSIPSFRHKQMERHRHGPNLANDNVR